MARAEDTLKGVTPDVVKRGEKAKARAAALRKGISTAPSVIKGFRESGITGGRGAPPVKTISPKTEPVVASFPDRSMANSFSDMVSRVGSGRVNKEVAPDTVTPAIRPAKSTGVRGMTQNQRAVARLNAFDKDLAVSGTPRQVGGYEVSGMTSGELERFSRTPTRPGTQMARTGRPEGGWRPDYGRGDTSEQMPKFDAPGFEGPAKAARIHSQEQRWLRERRGASDKMALLETAESGETARQKIRQDAIDLQETSGKQLATEAQRYKVSEKNIAEKKAILKSRYDSTMKGYESGAKYDKESKTRESHEDYLRRVDPEVANEYYGKKAKAGSVGSYVSAIE